MVYKFFIEQKRFSIFQYIKRGKNFYQTKVSNVNPGENSNIIILRKLDFFFSFTQIFEAYYEGISLGISDDAQFIDLLKATWSLNY